jgi:hypothetical protein
MQLSKKDLRHLAAFGLEYEQKTNAAKSVYTY